MKRKPTQSNAIESASTLKSLYEVMLQIRRFEEKVADLLLCSPSEIVCPVHLYIGQEAIAAGVCANLRKEDYVFSTHRSHGHYLAKCGDMNGLMAELYCKATGCSRGRGGSMHLASPENGLPGSSAIVAGTIPLAVGAALAFSIQGKDSVSVAFFGDGAVGEGAFYESMNFAALKKLPVIFVCENNFYSTHLPVASCLASGDIYKKAEAFNMPGIRVDGNDAMEVCQSAKKAIENARAGNGPTLLECTTYRWRGHVGPHDDLDKGLRSKEELDFWMSRDPVSRMESALTQRGIMSQSEIKKLYDDVDRAVSEALAFAKESAYPEESELLANVYKG